MVALKRCGFATFPVALKRNAAPACAKLFAPRRFGAKVAQKWRRRSSNRHYFNALNSIVAAAQKLAQVGANTKNARCASLSISRDKRRAAVTSSSTALPQDPGELDREHRGGYQKDDDVHHSRLFLFVDLPASPHGPSPLEMRFPRKMPVLPPFQRRPVIARARRPDDVRRPGQRALAQHGGGTRADHAAIMIRRRNGPRGADF